METEKKTFTHLKEAHVDITIDMWNMLKYKIILCCISYCLAVRCHKKHTHTHLGQTSSDTCEGDVCVLSRQSINQYNDYQFCYKGLHTYNKADYCEERQDGGIMCLCRTDYCNTLDLPDRKLPTTIQLVNCDSYGLSQAVTNLVGQDICYYEELKQFDRMVDRKSSNYGVFSLGVSINEINLLNIPYPNACYNYTSDNENYLFTCACRWGLCNKGPPYTVERGKVKCYHDRSNGSRNAYCTGQYCVYTPPSQFMPSRYGCLSAYEEGPFKLELGLIQAWEQQLYLCNSDFCNDNINNIMSSVNTFKSSSAYEAYRLSLQQTPTVRAPESLTAHITFLTVICLVICLHVVYENDNA